MTIEEGIAALIESQKVSLGLSAAMDVFAEAAMQKTRPPYIVVMELEDDDDQALDGWIGSGHCEVDIECWSTSPSKAKAIGSAIRAFLRDYTGLAGDYTIQSSHLTGVKSADAYRGDGDQKKDFVYILNFEFHYRSAL